MIASGDYRNRHFSSTPSGTESTTEIDWFGGGYPPGYGHGGQGAGQDSGYHAYDSYDGYQDEQQGSGYYDSGYQSYPGQQAGAAYASSHPAAATALRERDPHRGPEASVITSAFTVTTEDVLDVLGPDADDLLATANLDVDALISMINAETMLLPRIDEELEAMFAAESAEEPELQRAPRTEGAKTPVETAGKRWKKRFLKATIAAILLSATGGGAMAMAMDKDVTVDVDGHETHVRTYDSTVGSVLASQGIQPGMHDSLSPSPNAPVTDGGKIMLERGRLLKVTVDGNETDHWTRSQNVADALREMKLDTKGAWMSSGAGSQIPLQGMAVSIRTPKAVTVIDGANAPVQLTTTDATIGDFLKSQHISIGPNDSVNVALDVKITGNMQVLISRTGDSVITVTQSIAPQTTTIQDPTMNEGDQNVDNPGTPGSEVVTYRVHLVNGKEVGRDQLSVNITQQPVNKVLRVGTKPLPDDAVWDRIAQCESGGNWAIDTGNGYYGGLQFNHATWISNGGGAYGANANLATKAQQIEIADRVRAARGYEPWQCAGELGIH